MDSTNNDPRDEKKVAELKMSLNGPTKYSYSKATDRRLYVEARNFILYQISFRPKSSLTMPDLEHICVKTPPASKRAFGLSNSTMRPSSRTKTRL